MHKMVQDFEKLIRERLKPSRYQHSLNVANEAAKLAKLYGADEDKAYICGILHDVMKNASPDEQLSLINESGRKLSDLEMSNQKLWHAIAGAAYLEKTLKIDDDEMVEAV
ncbi:MAG: HDIG domain-containing protein, partial [Oscillospiraceae bacterium]